MHLQDRDVASHLQGADSVRDGALVALSFSQAAQKAAPAIDLVFEKKTRDVVRIFRMNLREVSSFDFSREVYEPFEIAMFTCVWTDEGFYLSLDPWEEGTPSDRDNNCFRSRFVSMTIETR